jgi:hypothetical protein
MGACHRYCCCGAEPHKVVLVWPTSLTIAVTTAGVLPKSSLSDQLQAALTGHVWLYSSPCLCNCRQICEHCANHHPNRTYDDTTASTWCTSEVVGTQGFKQVRSINGLATVCHATIGAQCDTCTRASHAARTMKPGLACKGHTEGRHASSCASERALKASPKPSVHSCSATAVYAAKHTHTRERSQITTTPHPPSATGSQTQHMQTGAPA